MPKNDSQLKLAQVIEIPARIDGIRIYRTAIIHMGIAEDSEETRNEIGKQLKKGVHKMANPLKTPKIFVKKEGDIFVLADPFGIISVQISAENATKEEWDFLEANIGQVVYAPDFIL